MTIIWSEKQKAVFDNVARGSGHTVLRARAGSAKTTTSVESLKHVPHTPRYHTSVFVAFNKSIANTLKHKVRGGEVSTFHSYGLKNCSRALGRVEVDDDRVMKICKTQVWGQDWKYRRPVEKIVSLSKSVLAGNFEEVDELIDNFGVDLPKGLDAEGRIILIKRVLDVLEQCKDVRGSIDFDDMVWLPVVLDLQTFSFDRVFVDELQDMNPAQLQLALKMVAPGGRMLAVGDDRQAIYSWRGAKHEAVDWLADHLNATVLPLTICYRCDRNIIELAREIVPDIEPAPDAGEGLINEAGREGMLKYAEPGDFVLSRSNAPLVSACLNFLRNDRRARIQGRDIGSSLSSFIKNSGVRDVPMFRSYVESWQLQETERLMKCDPPRNPQAVIDKAETLIALSEGMSTLEAIVERIERLFSDNGEQQIVLSTIHKAKGLEAPHVWILGDSFTGCHFWAEKMRSKAEGLGDEDKSWRQAQARLREENNLLYVAFTRAEHQLSFVDGCPTTLQELE